MASDLINAANDLKKMRRSMRLREESDPEVVANALEALLKENVAMRSLDNGALGKNAAREVADIRNALVANQVNAGERQTDLIGKFSAVTEQFEHIDMNERRSRNENGVVSQGLSSLKGSIPSADALASAMMTANPLLGYAFRTLNNIRKNRSESKKRSDMEAKKRLDVLQRQQSVIQEQMSNEEKAGKVIEDSPIDQGAIALEGPTSESAGAPKKAATQGRRKGIYAESLEAIQKEIKMLNDFLKSDSDFTQEQIGKMESAEESSKENIIELEDKLGESLTGLENQYESDNQELVSTMEEVPESINNKLQELIDNDNKESRLERDRRGKQGLLDREKDYKKKPQGSSVLSVGKEKGGIPLLGMLGGLLGAGAGILGGAVAGIAGFAKKILSPFVGLLGFLKKGGSLLGRFARFGVVTTALFAIYDFFDGFFSASRILQKSANSIDWKDRVKTGFASIVSGILSPIDWMAEKLGVEGGIFKGSRDDFTRKVVGVYDSIFEAVEEIFDSVLQVFEKVKGFVSDQVLSKLPNWMTDWASDKDENGNDKPKTQTGWFSLDNWWKKEEPSSEVSKAINEGATSSEPNNKPRLDDPGPYSSRMMEESTNRANQAMNNAAKKVANDGTSNNVDNSNSGNNTVVAPTNSQTINTSNSFSRVSDSHNNEPTHRRFLGGFLSLNY